MNQYLTATIRVVKGVQQMRTLVYGAIALVIALIAVGCGGGSTSAPLPSASSWTQTDATYVGRATCKNCHATIADQYQLSAKGDGVSDRHNNTGCQNCHVTGPEALPFNADGTIAAGAIPEHLKTIGCENCHGPGSKHVDSRGNKTDITRVPPAQETCIACHSDRPYKSIEKPETLVTDATLRSQSTTMRGPHYAAGAFMLGRNGYNIPAAMPSPHSTLPNKCLACHTPPVDPATNMVNHGVTAWNTPNLDTSRAVCSSCHGGRTETLVQTAVNEAMIRLGGEDPDEPGHFDSNADGGLLAAFATAYDVHNVTNPDDPKVVAYKAARWNFKTIYSDHSLGVHNPGFAQLQLTNAEKLLRDADTGNLLP
ncbi:MAG: multiheme c-type cytochrome [Armatimonadota bacterium]